MFTVAKAILEVLTVLQQLNREFKNREAAQPLKTM